MKVLVLSCSTGGGHNSAAKAVKEAFENSGDECELIDMHSLINKKRTKQAARIYSFIVLRLSWLFGAAYSVASLISHPGGHSPIYIFNIKYAKVIYKYIVENNIDAVVCTHLFPAEAMTRIKRKYAPDFPFFFVATDYTCSPFNEETTPDLFFIPHAELTSEYRGVDEDKKVPTGIPCAAKFRNIDKNSARESAGVTGTDGHILFMGGSMGFGNMWNTLRKIKKALPGDYTYTVLGGHNSALKKGFYKLSGQKNVNFVDFTEHAEIYIGSADVIFTKPGGLTTTEAAVAGIPIVHTKPIPGCETKNASFFSAHGMSVIYKKNKDVKKVIDIIEKEEVRQDMLKRQKENINASAADDICRTITENIKNRKGA